MFVLIRALVFATLFIGFVLVYLPAQLLSSAGVARPAGFGFVQFAGMFICAVGAAIALWCILAFAFVGRGTPAPFDPPKKLVMRGPYRFVRNPMYLGAGLALAGAAFFYESIPFWLYTAGFLLVMHLFVILYEEPALRQSFGEEYETYRRHVRRWLPTTGRKV